MGKRIRIIIEYDLDLDYGVEATGEMVHKEMMDWREGKVSVEDFLIEDQDDFRFTLKAEIV